MSANTVDNLGDYLQAQGVGTLASDLFLGGFPLDGQGVALVDTGGTPMVRARGDYMQTVQVLCRHTAQPTARAKAWEVWDLLNGTGKLQIGSSGSADVIFDCKAVQPPISLGQDERQRWTFACNYQVTMRKHPASPVI